ncbi:MAG: tRNA lysidine(34) synthetase TilS [Lewinella sp.]
MKTLVDTFRDFVERERLFTKADKLLLACSGGLDSTVLAHLLHAEGYDFAIAHMNFQLRGEASDGDAAFVEELARTLDAKFYCKAVDVKGQAKPGESTQMTARRLRYDWFDALRKQNEYVTLLTAHHANDNFETFLINLLRSSGTKGLRGMVPISVSAVRPLLSSSKEEIVEYANTHALSWREDVSNASDDYLRNRIRHHLAPIFFEEFGYQTSQWNQTASILRGEYNMITHRIIIMTETIMKNYHLSVIDREKYRTSTQTAYIHHQHTGFTTEQIRQIVYATRNLVVKGNEHTAYVTEQEITLLHNNVIDKKRPSIKVDLLPYRTNYELNSVELDLVDRPINVEVPDALFIAPPTLPLHLRPRQKGDRFQPLGLGGKTKKVKDYMIDKKIPVWLRDRIYLLVNEQDEIMAIPGYCISDNFKVLPEHETVLRIR